jgi:hypothetical protein
MVDLLQTLRPRRLLTFVAASKSLLALVCVLMTKLVCNRWWCWL